MEYAVLQASLPMTPKSVVVITPWFGEWNDANGTAWQQAIMGKVTVEQALNSSATKWTELKKQS